MYMMREVLHCRPGKVGELVARFRELGTVMEELGYPPFRLYTDVSGERFWTLVLESESDSMDGFLDMESKVMADERARSAMSGYHDLVIEGRREVFRVES